MKSSPWSPASGPVWDQHFDQGERKPLQEWFEERAAIIECEAQIGRQTAEIYAYAYVVRGLVRTGALKPQCEAIEKQVKRADSFDREAVRLMKLLLVRVSR